MLNPAVEDVVFHSAALAGLAHLRRLTLQGRLPAHRRRMHRRALPHLGPSLTHLAAHGLNLGDTDWSAARRLHTLDLSHSGAGRAAVGWGGGGEGAGAASAVGCGWACNLVGQRQEQPCIAFRQRISLPLCFSHCVSLAPPTPPLPLPADVRLGPYCGALLAGLRELVLRGAALELSTPAVFADMASLRRLDLEGCTAARTGSWLTRVLGPAPDVVALPPGLTQLRAMGCNAFDKCTLQLGACTGLQRLELSSGAQLPATLKHVPRGVPLGLHIAEEAQVGDRGRWLAGWLARGARAACGVGWSSP